MFLTFYLFFISSRVAKIKGSKKNANMSVELL